MAFGSNNEHEGMSNLTRQPDCRQALAAVTPTVEEIESGLGSLIRDDDGKPHD
jgi:hypothetical protein